MPYAPNGKQEKKNQPTNQNELLTVKIELYLCLIIEALYHEELWGMEVKHEHS
jgi:hypothetical protein